MIFAQKLLAPEPGTRPKSTFRWSPIQSALSGSLFFKPPALPEVMTLTISFLVMLAPLHFSPSRRMID
jgi:hypothetical protein